MSRPITTIVLLASIALGGGVGRGAGPSNDEPSQPALPDEWVKAFEWRCIGPANMGGRITSLAVYEKDPSIWWVGTASGGLLKTTNNGVTFEHQFDHEATVSVGDVAVAQSDPNIVWVGTGECNPRNSVTWGDGVYKSTDGGKTWKNMGLNAAFQIGSIAIHPTNPDVVYVGAVGRLWGPNEERGLYKSTDGGATWERVLFVDDKTGIIDLAMHPDDPDTLLAAAYERQRDGYDSNEPAKRWGPGSGLYKTTDAGQTWTKLTSGLPTSNLGRIGIDFYRKDPSVIYIVLECERLGQEPENAPYAGLRGEDADVGARLTDITKDGPSEAAGLKSGDIVVAVDSVTVHSYDDLVRQIRRHSSGDTAQFEVSRERKSVSIDVTLATRPATNSQNGRTARGPFAVSLNGQRENVHEQQGPEGHEYGGVYRSCDGGETWTRINSVNPRPMYFSKIRVDPNDEQFVYVLGVSLYRSKDGGATFTGDGARGAHPDHHALWIDPHDGRHMILGNDGGLYASYDRGETWDHHNHMAIGQFYHVAVDPRRNYMAYGGLQDNGSWGGPSRVRYGDGPTNADWISIGGGDGFVCQVDRTDADQVYFESQNGGMGRFNLKSGERGSIRPSGQRGQRYRWNWKTPFILSNHNPRIVYAAGNYVFRSLDRGEHLKAISPEITRGKKGSATALAESPRDGDVLYVGTDDGALWVTRNGGHEWSTILDFPPDPESETPATPEESESGGGVEEIASAQPPEETAEPGEREPGDDPGELAARGEGGSAGPRRPQAGRMMERLLELDANKDGSIQRDEVPERMGRLFDRADTNGNDVIDADELATMRERARSQRPPGRERPEEAPPSDPARAEQTGAGPEQAESAKAEDTAAVAAPPADPADDPLSGEWTAEILGDDIPQERREWKLVFRLAADGSVTGTMTTAMTSGEISSGKFDASSKGLTYVYDSGRMVMDITATLGASDDMTGRADAGEGSFTFDFKARRTNAIAAADVTVQTGEKEEVDPDAKPLQEQLPGPRWVSSLEASRYKNGRVYLTLDGHRSDDDEPYVFVSENYGKTWRSIRANLPTSAGSTRVIREDVVGENILYLGTEFGAWVSVDRGASWTKLNNNLPTVAVHEFAVHPTAGEVVAATHGRSLWVLDVTALRQMSRDAVASKAKLYRPNSAVHWRSDPNRGSQGARRFVGQNPADGAQIYYSLSSAPEQLSLRVVGPTGETIRELAAPADAGLHRVSWDLRRTPPAGGPRRGGSGGSASAAGGRREGPPAAASPAAGRARGRGGFARRGGLVEPGKYAVVLSVDGQTYTQTVAVETDPEYPDYRAWELDAQMRARDEAEQAERAELAEPEPDI